MGEGKKRLVPLVGLGEKVVVLLKPLQATNLSETIYRWFEGCEVHCHWLMSRRIPAGAASLAFCCLRGCPGTRCGFWMYPL